MPVAPGLPIILPEYVQSAYGYEVSIPLTAHPTGNTWRYFASGDYIEVPITCYCTFTTDATVGNRIMTAAIIDTNNANLYVIPAPVQQPASQTWQYTFSILIGSPVGTSGTVYASPLPAAMLQAGWRFEINTSVVSGVETVSQPILTVMRFITGVSPTRDQPAVQQLRPVAV